MEKKVRILTRRAGYNFGSSLQAYAMQQIVRNAGYDNLVVDYDEYHHNIRWKIRPFIEDVSYQILRILPFLNKKEYTRLYFRDIQRKRFNQFDHILNKTKGKCRTSKDLHREMNDCDAVICGSDQIWSPFLYDSNFYFDFITNPNVKRIAYAPSLGTQDSSLFTEKMVESIKKFDSISIREQGGVGFIEQRTGKKCKMVLDPTLLLDSTEWDKVKTDYSIDGEYILCYFLGQKNIPNKFIKTLKEHTGLQVVNIQMYYNINKLKADKQLYDIAPSEFLSLLSKANYVCTDSFHGTIFSYIYKKNFFVFDRFKSNDIINQNSRIDNLLKIIDMEYRRKTDDSLLIDNIDTDYFSVSVSSYNNLKAISFDYLKEALSHLNKT